MTADDWSQLALTGALISAVAAMGTTVFRTRAVSRPLYWVLAYVGVTCLALYATPRGWIETAQFTIAGAGFAVGYAYFASPFLKIKGRVYASELENAEPGSGTDTQSYDGRHSAATTWWMMAVGSCLLAIALVATLWTPPMLVLVAIGSALSALFGYDDGSRGFPYARGQVLPFRIAAIASLAGACLPLLCYLCAYRRGERRPGYGKHDVVRQRRRNRRDGPLS